MNQDLWSLNLNPDKYVIETYHNVPGNCIALWFFYWVIATRVFCYSISSYY